LTPIFLMRQSRISCQHCGQIWLNIRTKLFCVLLFVGLASAKIDASKFNSNTLRRPVIRSTSSSARLFWDPNFCLDWNDMDAFPHPDSCAEYLICWGGELLELTCPDDMLFDIIDLVCDHPDFVVCLGDPWPPTEDPDCPPAGSNEIRFLPSNFCDEFYICINGQPVLHFCRPGQHWNEHEEFCDDPEFAGCDPDAGPPGGRLPECPPGVTSQFPHPHNCNWFIHCNNGNRSIQQCQHLHHFDIVYGRCLFQSVARCIKNA